MDPSTLWKPSFIRLATVLLGCTALAVGAGLIATTASVAQETPGPIVTVAGGQVQGRLLPGGGATFKGIPYAAPPVGDLRWRETQLLKSWTGVRQVVEYGNICPQAGGARGRKTSEDCLLLNVWTPDWPASSNAKRPVMIWVNGGGLTGGSGSLAAGSESLTRHGVVLVSANLRGQLFGMPGLPELTAESPHRSSGNYMYYDEIAVLKWIRDNIARFGGDPNNVTIFGQSGGAHIISTILSMPQAKGLIHRAIVQSGAVSDVRPHLTMKELEQMGLVMAKALNAPSTGTLKYLRSLSAEQISAAMPAVRKGMAEINYGAYDSGVDGYIIPENPLDVARAGKQLAIPLMVGHTALDSAVVNAAYKYSGFNNGHVTNKLPANDEEAVGWVRDTLELFYKEYPDLKEQALQAYGINGQAKEKMDYLPYGTLVKQVGTDLNHRCGTQVMAMWHGKVAPAWTYEFSRSTPGHPALHGSENPYVFGRLAEHDRSDDNARKLSDTIQRYWTNFAKTGNPNGPGLPEWPQFKPETKKSLEFVNDAAIVKTANRAVACVPYVEKFNRDPHPQLGGANTPVRPGNVGEDYK